MIESGSGMPSGHQVKLSMIVKKYFIPLRLKGQITLVGGTVPEIDEHADTKNTFLMVNDHTIDGGE